MSLRTHLIKPTTLFFTLSSACCFAQSIYSVSIDTTRLQGASGTLIFDLTSNYALTNRADILNFTTDGVTALPQTQGAVTGDLVQGLQPAQLTRMKGNEFFTELAVPFKSFGDRITFSINVSETGPAEGRPPDDFAIYLLGADGRALGTANVRDWKPNLSLAITGERGGQLELSRAVPGVRGAQSSELTSAEATAGGAVTFAVIPGWSSDAPTARQAKVFEGNLTEHFNGRCNAENICSNGVYGLTVNGAFYAFDDASNLKAQVALVKGGQHPLAEKQGRHVRVTGVLNGNSTLTVREITLE